MKRFIPILLIVLLSLTGCGNYNPLSVLQFAPAESEASDRGDETSGNPVTNTGNNQAPPPLYTIESLVSVAGETTGLAGNRDFLFWIDDVFGKGIWRSDRNGANPQLLVPRLRQPEGLTVSGNALYWVERWNGKTLRRMLLDGSQPTTLRRVEDSYILPAMLIADEETIYWGVDTGDGATRYRIERISIADAAVTTLYRTPVPIEAFQADTAFIYWMEGISSDFKLYRMAKSGSDPELLAEGLSEPITRLILSPDGILFGSWSKIVRIPNGSRSEQVLVSGPTQFTPGSLNLYQGKLYWLDYSSPLGTEIRIASAPVTGGDFSIVAEHLRNAGQLVVLETGLYWGEDAPTSTADYNRYRHWRRLDWNSQTPETLASGLFVNGVYVADGRFYFSEYDYFSKFAQITSLPVAGGEVQLVLGGVNTDRAILAAEGSDLFFGDGGAVKKVAAGGGPAKTFGIDGRWEIEHLYVSEGSVYLSSNGILPNGLYKVAAEGEVPIVLTENGMLDEYGEILAVHDGYVYYKFRPSADYPIFRKLYRVPVVGGSPERILALGENHELLGFEVPTTVYYANQGRDLLKYDIVTTQNQRLGFAGDRFLGFDDSYVFVDSSSSGTSVSRITKDGSNFPEFVLGVGSPYYLSGWLLYGGEIYFSASQLSNTGVVSEIARLQPTGN
jgi:predicted small lipoprotein YifL